MSKAQKILRYFRCPDCGISMTATKRASIMHSNKSHIKTMYCYNCKEKKDFILYDTERLKK